MSDELSFKEIQAALEAQETNQEAYDAVSPVAQKPSLAKMGIKHSAIIDYLLANPQAKMQEVATIFRVSPSWLSIIVNSQVFQAELQEKSANLFDATVVPLRAKIHGVADVAMERLGSAVENSQSPDFLLRAAEATAKMLGYGVKQTVQGDVTVNQQNNTYVVNKDELARARSTMLQINRGESFDEKQSVSSPEALQASAQRTLGSTSRDSTNVLEHDETEGEKGAGGPVREEGA